MFDFLAVIGFEWDDGSARKSVEKHGISQTEAEQVFSNEPLLLMDDKKHSGDEPRYHAYGCTNQGRLIQISFTMRQDNTLIRIISSRPMSARERTRYEQET